MKWWRKEAFLDLYCLFASAFLFVSPWLFGFVKDSARIDIWTSSLLVALTSITAIVAFADWEEWFNLLMGVWLIVSPWLLNFTHTTAMHISIAVGLIVTYLACLELWIEHYDPEQWGPPLQDRHPPSPGK